MEEILKLLRENNEMLRFICKYIIAKGSPEQQDQRTLNMNFFADIISNALFNQNQQINGKSK